jgi:hypothetical protein
MLDDKKIITSDSYHQYYEPTNQDLQTVRQDPQHQ